MAVRYAGHLVVWSVKENSNLFMYLLQSGCLMELTAVMGFVEHFAKFERDKCIFSFAQLCF